jgi:hypothetical protein
MDDGSSLRYTSVQTERPTDTHPPIPSETGWLIAASLLFAALIFGLMAAVHYLGRTPAPAPMPADPAPDQEWAHYPQPVDKSERS